MGFMSLVINIHYIYVIVSRKCAKKPFLEAKIKISYVYTMEYKCYYCHNKIINLSKSVMAYQI